MAGGEREGLLTQTSLDSSVFTRRKMSQAEKQRGWVKMKQSAVSAVKISGRRLLPEAPPYGPD